ENSQACEAVLVLLLDELVVQRAAAEARGKIFLEDALHRAADECHTLASELAEAPNVAHVRGEPELLERTATGPRLHGTEVVGFHVEQDLRRSRQERSELKRRHEDVEARHFVRRLNKRQVVHVEVL